MRGKARIAIVGAGIGGLTAALALLQRGFDVTVYEQAEELREVGAGLQISANGTRVLFHLGLEAALRPVASEPEGKEIRLWSSGQTWKLFDLGAESVRLYGYPYLMFHRADLHSVLADSVRRTQPSAIILGARCLGVETSGAGVKLHIEGQTATQADAIIVADGVHSRIRALLVGDDAPEFTGIVAWRGVIPTARLPRELTRPVGTNWIGPGGHVIQYPLRRGELMNFVGIRECDDWTEESWTARGTLEQCAADFSAWHPDIHRLIENVEVPYRWALMSRKPLSRWSFGPITLLGDAAHPTLPFLAQGAGMAIEDAMIVARCLDAAGDIEPAFRRYEAARLDRTTRIVQGSAENARRFHNPQLADDHLAAAYVDREWSPQRIRERYEWLFAYDALTEPV
jgi:salicylate hydroxylase